MRSHGAVASYALGEEVWDAVVADWRNAPLRPEVKATLAFLEQLTLRPDELTEVHVDAARAAGVSDQALRDAAAVCALFTIIVRLADSLGWDVPSADVLRRRAPLMLEGGYSLDAILARAKSAGG
jgi:alkylhydroperoxidase family enzyme